MADAEGVEPSSRDRQSSIIIRYTSDPYLAGHEGLEPSTF